MHQENSHSLLHNAWRNILVLAVHLIIKLLHCAVIKRRGPALPVSWSARTQRATCPKPPSPNGLKTYQRSFSTLLSPILGSENQKALRLSIRLRSSALIGVFTDSFSPLKFHIIASQSVESNGTLGPPRLAGFWLTLTFPKSGPGRFAMLIVTVPVAAIRVVAEGNRRSAVRNETKKIRLVKYGSRR